MNAPTRLRSLLVTRLLVSGWLATLAFPVGTASARVMAPDPVVVVVESEFRRTDAAAVREAIAAALGAPVLRLTDPGANRARGTLSIVFEADGRHAHIYFRRASGDQAAVLVEVVAGRGADAEGRWIAEPGRSSRAHAGPLGRHDPRQRGAGPVAARARAARAAPGEIHMLPDLADPFEGEPARDINIAVDRYYYGSEVLNPWAHSSNPESAERLAAPRPAAR
jgi:hypothetical protein